MRWRWEPSTLPVSWVLGCCLLALSSSVYPGPHGQPSRYSKLRPEFMPAEPGETPSCVKDPRLTYCTDPDDYPKDRILYLLNNNMFDVSTFVMDETRDTYTFETMEREMPMYGGYGGYSPPQHSYLPPVQSTAMYSNASQYNYQLPKSGGFSYRAPNSKYGSQFRSNLESNAATTSLRAITFPVNSSLSTYTSYLPPPPASNEIKSGRQDFVSGRSVVGSSTNHNFDPSNLDAYSRPVLYFSDDVDDVFSSYPTFAENSNRQKVASYARPNVPSFRSFAWWTKVLHGGRQRRQLPDGDEDLCPSRASYIMPRAAQSIGGNWMYLVNLDDDPRYTQLVRSETCIRNQCTGSCQAPPGSLAVCQQQFVQKRLVALDGSGERLNQDIFWFPSCCVCKIRRR